MQFVNRRRETTQNTKFSVFKLPQTCIAREVNMKTAAAVLQELAVKLGCTPEYECISQTGPQHQSTFEYRCTLFNESVTASARSKKDAKQDAANAMLKQLARAGYSVPPPWGYGGDAQIGSLSGHLGGLKGLGVASATSALDTHSYVALLKEYCEEYKLPAPEYTLIGDSGPPHLRSFTIRATVGAHSRDATALNKKAARQMAAEAIYKYLRGCLRSTQDFVEADALERCLDKKLGRFTEERKDIPWRPPLCQKISEYQYGLVLQFDELKRDAAMEALRSTALANQPQSIQLECGASQLGLDVVWKEMPSVTKDPLVLVELPTTSPNLMFMGADRDDAASHMVRYLNRALMIRAPEPTTLII